LAARSLSRPPDVPEYVPLERDALIEQIKLLARWCAARKYSATGRKKDAVYMKPNPGDPLPLTHPDVHRWIKANLARFQNLVTQTR
jgi:hypothetical protein